jgi:hypothetical protein
MKRKKDGLLIERGLKKWLLLYPSILACGETIGQRRQAAMPPTAKGASQ